ncbi:Cytoplasmic dynein 1 light intermediate chain 2 [Blyttiomyces sp. JEL0837]|nr:Cytoplasmic dynein 1 light intermediate chain 2 [Blyttiomyces sp. JEL0837]
MNGLVLNPRVTSSLAGNQEPNSASSSQMSFFESGFMDGVKVNSNEAEETLWGNILREASSSRTTPTRNILIMGDSKSGKSTILNALRHPNNTDQSMPHHHILVPSVPVQDDGDDQVGAGLALSYSYMDIVDDEAEEPTARIGIFELDSDANYGPLIRFALSPERLPHSAVVICLEWSKPWQFFEQLEKFLIMLQREIEYTAATAKRGLLEELRDRLETHVREYKEPEPPGSSQSNFASGKHDSALASSMSHHNVNIPLGPGVLTNNLGVPIHIVCTKSDLTLSLEKEREFTEDQFDFIQQSLRTICLKYGASLHYVSMQRPNTISTLRSYLLHRLLDGTEAVISAFTQRAQVVDRDTIFVPAGWDSWGMIRVQGESFSCESIAGIDEDSSSAVDYVAALARGRSVYQMQVQNPKIDKSFAMNVFIAADDEQAFLERNLELLQSMSGSGLSGTSSPLGSGLADGLTSRLASNTMSSSDMLEDVSLKLQRLAKLKEQTSASVIARDKIPLPAALQSSSMGVGAGAALNGSSSQNEVLANFFQSLLSKKSTGTGGPGRSASMTGNRSPSMSNGALPPAGNNNPVGSPNGSPGSAGSPPVSKAPGSS